MTTETEILEPQAVIPLPAPPTPAVTQPQAAHPITPQQAKIEAVATLTMAAYQKAATLKLSDEEIKALQADFPDDAFQPGAAGKENLIYIEHAHLRDRLNAVFGPGQWAIIPRNRWNESFTTSKGQPGERVYVEAMLIVRGAFVAEAVGAMEYFPNNAAQNYGDAVEGAKTAALRRCCKELGIGLQAWKKEWCAGWWQRRNRPAKPHVATVPPPATKAEAPHKGSNKQAFPTNESRSKMIAAMKAGLGEPNRDIVTEFFQKCDALLPTEELEDVPLRFCPATVGQMNALGRAIGEFQAGDQARLPYPPHDVSETPAASSEEVKEDRDDAEWRSFLMPFGKNSGTPLAELEKNYLFGLWANYVVETEYNGKPKRPETITKDKKFREMLDDAGMHYQFKKN